MTGRVQIQVSYEADRKELVVSVLAADDLCCREDTGYGSMPEAFAKLDLISMRQVYKVSELQHSFIIYTMCVAGRKLPLLYLPS